MSVLTLITCFTELTMKHVRSVWILVFDNRELTLKRIPSVWIIDSDSRRLPSKQVLSVRNTLGSIFELAPDRYKSVRMSEKGLAGLTNTKERPAWRMVTVLISWRMAPLQCNSRHPTSTHNSPRSLWSRDFIVRVRYPASYPSYCLRAVIRRLRRRSLCAQTGISQFIQIRYSVNIFHL